MTNGFYLELLLGAVPNNYVIEDSVDFSQNREVYLLISITDNYKYYVSLFLETDENMINITLMRDSHDTNREYQEEYKHLKNVSQYKFHELQAKLKDIICTEMKTFVNK